MSVSQCEGTKHTNNTNNLVTNIFKSILNYKIVNILYLLIHVYMTKNLINFIYRRLTLEKLFKISQ